VGTSSRRWTRGCSTGSSPTATLSCANRRLILPTATLSCANRRPILCQPPPYPANRRPILCQLPPYPMPTAALSSQPPPYPVPTAALSSQGRGTNLFETVDARVQHWQRRERERERRGYEPSALHKHKNQAMLGVWDEGQGVMKSGISRTTSSRRWTRACSTGSSQPVS